MRVAIVQETIEPARGGAETSTRQMAEHLAALGLEVTVLCAARPGVTDSPFEAHGARYLPLPARGPTRMLRSHAFMRSAADCCRSSRFDIVHAITPCLAADVYQPRGGTLPETVRRSTAMVAQPALRTLRRLGKLLNTRQRLLCQAERRLLSDRGGTVQVAALSDYVRHQITADYNFPPERVHVIFNGVEVMPLEQSESAACRAEIRKQLQMLPDGPLLLFVAHNFRLKGLAELLRALATHPGPGPNWRLAVIGRDAPGPYLRLAGQLGLTGRLRFLGSQPDLRPWYAAADVLAHPTWYDPCSRVVLEALALGLPAVTTRWNGASDVLKPGIHGEIIETPADSAALAAAIRRALDTAVRAACRADCARLRRAVSMQRHACEVRDLYERIVAARSSRPAPLGSAAL